MKEHEIKTEINALGNIKVMYEMKRIFITRDNIPYGENEGITLTYSEMKQIIDLIIGDITEDIYLKLKNENWINFFRVWFNRKSDIKLVDGSSLGNFSTLIQELEKQFREKTDFSISFYDLREDNNVKKGR